MAMLGEVGYWGEPADVIASNEGQPPSADLSSPPRGWPGCFSSNMALKAFMGKKQLAGANSITFLWRVVALSLRATEPTRVLRARPLLLYARRNRRRLGLAPTLPTPAPAQASAAA